MSAILRGRPSAAIVLIAALGLLPHMSGCAQSPRRGATTRFTISDIEYTSAELSAQLAAAPFLQGRAPDSPEIRLMPGEFRNVSNERIGEADRWAMISMILYDPGIFELLRSKNVSIVMPEQRKRLFERFAIAQEIPGQTPPTIVFGENSIATHAINTTFLSATREATDTAGTDERKDLFLIQTEIIDLGTGAAIWSGQTRFARVARGVILN
ncbi:MAG: hypothetical protein R3B57_10875 [Phycisphaerales bacterium]